MEFLHLPALYALGALPLLLVPYLVRRKPRRQIFSSLLLLQAFAIPPERRFLGKLKLPLLFFLQLLILALLIAASGDPVLRRTSGERLAVVLDNSASMQAIENRSSRFELAKQEAARMVREAPAGSRVGVYLTVPWIGPIGEDLTVNRALALLEDAKVYDLGDAVNDYSEAFERLAQEQGYDRVLFFTDRPVRGTSGVIRAISVGQPRGNVAITGLDLARGGLGRGGPSARVEITNFSSMEQRLELILLGENRPLRTLQRSIPAERNIAVTLDDLEAASYYEARIDTAGRGQDPLAMDNRRFAIVPGGEASTILGVSPRPEVLATLRVVPGLELETVEPTAYQTAWDRKVGLEIFHLAAPKELPRNNALFILPPEENPVVFQGDPIADATVSGWNDTHPLTRYVNLAMLRPRYSRPLEARVPARSIVESPAGALALVFERDKFRYAVLGFDPFPFLGRQNLPMSILTLNLLGWLQDGMTASNQTTGEPLELADEVVRGASTPLRVGSSGKDSSVRELPVLFQGVYERFRKGRRELVAVNFDAPAESDLLNPSPVLVEKTAMKNDAAAGHRPLWPYVVMLCFLLLTLEWFVTSPGRGSLRLGEVVDPRP